MQRQKLYPHAGAWLNGSAVRKGKRKKRRQERLIGCRAAGRDVGRGRAVQIEDAGNEIADRHAQLAPESALEAAVILSAAEEVAHQLAKHRAAFMNWTMRGVTAGPRKKPRENLRTMRAANSSSQEKAALTQAVYFSGQPSAIERPSNSPERMA